MGRFYKTDKPTFVDDIIYQAPHELMLNALKTQDAAFEEQQKELDAFDTMGDLLDFVDKDRDTRNERLDLHRGKANELAEKIQKNPALYQTYIGQINRARRDFNEDIKSGQLFEMDRTAKRRTKLRDQIMKNQNISEEARNQALLTIDREYQGVGKGDFAEDIHIYDQIDETQFQKDLKAVINVDTEGVSTTVPQNGYLITDGETKSYLTDERLQAIIESDPAMDDWKREQLQTLTRKLDNGEFGSEAEMHAEYKRRLDSFKQNTIDKLGFKKVSNVRDVKTDSAYWQKKRLGLDWTRFNYGKQKDEANLNSYKVNMAGNFENLPDAQVEVLYGEGEPGQRLEGLSEDGVNFPRAQMTTAQKRKALEAERLSLEGKLTKSGMTLEDFRNKMMTHEGRISLSESLGMSKEILARQANYDKSYSYKTVESPLGNGQDVIENIKYLKTVTNTFNNLPPNEKVTVKIVDNDGNVETSETMSLGEAFDKQYVQGQTSAKTKKELIPFQGGFKGTDGQVVLMPDPNDPESQVIATQEYVLARGLGQSKSVKVEEFDATKPLLHIKSDQVSQSKLRNFGNGRTKATEKQMHNIHTSKMIDGELKTIIISKELDIDPLK